MDRAHHRHRRDAPYVPGREASARRGNVCTAKNRLGLQRHAEVCSNPKQGTWRRPRRGSVHWSRTRVVGTELYARSPRGRVLLRDRYNLVELGRHVSYGTAHHHRHSAHRFRVSHRQASGSTPTPLYADTDSAGCKRESYRRRSQEAGPQRRTCSDDRRASRTDVWSCNAARRTAAAEAEPANIVELTMGTSTSDDPSMRLPQANLRAWLRRGWRSGWRRWRGCGGRGYRKRSGRSAMTSSIARRSQRRRYARRVSCLPTAKLARSSSAARAWLCCQRGDDRRGRRAPQPDATRRQALRSALSRA